MVACRSNWQFASSCETTESGNESGGEGEGKHNKAKITDGTNNFHAVKIINENRNKCFFMYSMKNAYNNCSAILLLCSINVCLAVINWKVTPPFTITSFIHWVLHQDSFTTYLKLTELAQNPLDYPHDSYPKNKNIMQKL